MSKFKFDIKDLIGTTLISFFLFFPILGIHKDTRGIEEIISFRLDWVGYAVLAVVLMRLILQNLMSFWGKQKPTENKSTQRSLQIQKWGIIAFVGVLLILPWMPFTDRLLLDRLTLTLIYVMLGWGLNIVIGLAGLLDLGYVAFYAVGAYSYALFAHAFGIGFWVALPLAGLLAAFFGMLLGFPVLRLRGDYLAIVTLGFGEIIRILILATPALGESRGISGIPRPTFFGMEFTANPTEGTTAFHEFFGLNFSSMHRIVFLYYLILLLALLTNWFSMRLRNLPIGRAWEALRENEIACQAIGINHINTKLTAFAIGAMFAGFAGSFFATRQGFISPESFTFLESATVVAIVVLGGLGSQLGIVLAAAFLILLPEYFREFQEFRMLFFGAAMVAVMTWKPRGFVGTREPTIRLHPKDYHPRLHPSDPPAPPTAVPNLAQGGA